MIGVAANIIFGTMTLLLSSVFTTVYLIFISSITPLIFKDQVIFT
ncbi:MAG: hypothetical protein WCG25_00925 [bacterium]